MSVSAYCLLPYVYALDSAVFILPAPPTNAVAINTTLTDVTLTWDASINDPANVASYTVFIKKDTDPSYPITPQITRTDALASYSENVTVEPRILYNFFIRTNATNSSVSQEECASCKTNNILLCGNGAIDAFVGEICDGILLNGADCLDFDFIGGALGCNPVTCLYSFASCSMGGGGNPIPEDNIAPDPGISVSPAYASTSPFSVTYSGATDIGGSGLAYVTLYAKRGTESWTNTKLASPGASGSFNFVPDPEYPNAIYYFDLQAFDNQGNQSPYPDDAGDTSTIYDTQLPTIETIMIPASSRTVPIAIAYENAVDVGISGLKNVELWYKIGEDGAWINSGQTDTATSTSFSFTPTTSNIYYLDLIAVDNAGNRSIEVTETLLPLMYDKDPPTFESVFTNVPTVDSPIVIKYTGAVDVGPAGLKTLDLWYKKEAEGTWTKTELNSTAQDGTFNYIPSESSGTYYFAIVLEDNFGNITEDPIGDGLAVVIYTAIPIVAVLSDLPDFVTVADSANITVGGTEITAYKYALDTGDYGAETPIEDQIILNNLDADIYTLSVIGMNSVGMWQDVSSPTTYSWTIETPEPAVAVLSTLPSVITDLPTASITVGGTNIVAYKLKFDAGTYGNEIPVDDKINLSNLSVGSHTLSVIGKNDVETWQSTDSSTAYSWLVIPPEEVIPHCDNAVQDADETGIDCGGSKCQVCLEVLLSVLAKPMGRTPLPGVYQTSGIVQLYSPIDGNLMNFAEISIGSIGIMQTLVRGINANTYNIGLKSKNYLQKILRGVVLEDNNLVRTLDFTLGGTFLLLGGDVYNDNIINAYDLALMLKNYLLVDESIDMNLDGIVNAADISMILRNYQLKGDSP